MARRTGSLTRVLRRPIGADLRSRARERWELAKLRIGVKIGRVELAKAYRTRGLETGNLALAAKAEAQIDDLVEDVEEEQERVDAAYLDSAVDLDKAAKIEQRAGPPQKPCFECGKIHPD